jgi:hypothetical protein
MTRHTGGNFDDFLSDDGLLEDCELMALGRVSDHETSQGLSSKVVEELRNIHHELLEKSKNLDPDSERTLRENLWDLYDS